MFLSDFILKEICVLERWVFHSHVHISTVNWLSAASLFEQVIQDVPAASSFSLPPVLCS